MCYIELAALPDPFVLVTDEGLSKLALHGLAKKICSMLLFILCVDAFLQSYCIIYLPTKPCKLSVIWLKSCSPDSIASSDQASTKQQPVRLV